MKFVCASLLVLTFSFCSGKNPTPENKLQIETTLKGVFNIPFNGTTRCYLIGLKLVNGSDSPIEFLTMTCSTVGNLVFNSNAVQKIIGNCAGNHLTTIKLNPKQEFSFNFILQSSEPYPDYLKIGWIIMTYENSHSPMEYSKYLEIYREKLENILWAPPLELGCCGGQPYEIE